MQIWKLECVSNDYAGFVHADRQDAIDGLSLTDGLPKTWTIPPRLEPFREKKMQKPLADISYLAPGSMVLSPNAYDALKDLLSPFGQLLEVQCVNALGLLADQKQESETYYFYNVTNIINCIDVERSEKRGSAIVKPVYRSDAIPSTVQIFKDPRRARTDIYVNDTAKDVFERVLGQEHILGATFVPV